MGDVISDEIPVVIVSDSPAAETVTPIDRRTRGDVARPIVVDLGRKRAKRIKQLKRGEGPLAKEVAELIEQARTELASELAGKTLLPLVVIYRKKKRRSRTLPVPFGKS
jgi:hypothetical protein